MPQPRFAVGAFVVLACTFAISTPGWSRERTSPNRSVTRDNGTVTVTASRKARDFAADGGEVEMAEARAIDQMQKPRPRSGIDRNRLSALRVPVVSRTNRVR
jgi:hypothetical protein